MSAALSHYANPEASLGHAGALTHLPPTCHAYPWALVKRGGVVEGQRPRSRMAYLTGTYVPRGETKAAALTGFFVRIDRRGCVFRATKGTVRVGWGEIVHSWLRQPTQAQVKRRQQRQERSPAATRDAGSAA